MLFGMERDCPLSRLRFPVSRLALALFLGHVLPATISTHEAFRRIVKRSGFGSATGCKDAVVRVVDWKRPTDRFNRTIEPRRPWVRNHSERRHRHFRDAAEYFALDASDLRAGDANWRRLEGYVGHLSHLGNKLDSTECRMKDRNMVRIHYVFPMLKPVAGRDHIAARSQTPAVRFDPFAGL